MIETLTAAETSKLFGLLGMLASPFDGERATAAMLATRLIKSKNLTWTDLIRPALAYHNPAPPPPPPSSRGWRTTVAACAAYPHLLTPWERDFLDSVTGSRSLSVRQRECLDKIIARLALYGVKL